MAEKVVPKKSGMVGTPRGYIPAEGRDRIDKSMSSAASKAGRALTAAGEFVFGDQSVARSKLNITRLENETRKNLERSKKRSAVPPKPRLRPASGKKK